MIEAWSTYFKCRIPRVKPTDGFEVMNGSIHSIPYSDKNFHLTCTFYLFDVNVKKRVQGIVSNFDSTSCWVQFWKLLYMLRESTSEKEAVLKWNELLKLWIPDTRQGRHATIYVKEHVWSKKLRCAVSYFEHEFAMRYATTQRPESWNDFDESVFKRNQLYWSCP